MVQRGPAHPVAARHHCLWQAGRRIGANRRQLVGREFRGAAFFVLSLGFASAVPSRCRSRIRTRSNSAKAPITDRSSVAMGESSPENVGCS